jgi:hypothetical protein
MLKTNKKNGILLFIAVVLLGTMALTACSGSAVIDVNVDPNTGQGNIVVNSDQPSDGDGELDVDINTDDGNQDMSQILLFGIVIALLLGTVAIVVSTTRRDRA